MGPPDVLPLFALKPRGLGLSLTHNKIWFLNPVCEPTRKFFDTIWIRLTKQMVKNATRSALRMTDSLDLKVRRYTTKYSSQTN